MRDPHDNFITRSEFGAFAKDVTNELKSIGDKLDSKTRPNWSAVGVGLSLIIVLCGAMFYYFNTRMALQAGFEQQSWVQTNTRIERMENVQDRTKEDLARRYLDYIDRNIAP